MIDLNEARRRWAGIVTPSDDDVVIRPGLQAACDAWGNVWDDDGDDPFLAHHGLLSGDESG